MSNTNGTSIETLIDIGGYKIFTKVTGKGSFYPTVVMDSGYGDDSKTWNSVIDEIASFTKVFVYDRAGLGQSEKSLNIHTRTSNEMMQELKQILVKSEISPPFLLVGHSFGGVNMRLFASMYPNEVAGILLVDATPEDYRERFLPSMTDEFREKYHTQFITESTYDEFMQSLNQIKRSRFIGSIPVLILSAGKKAHYSPSSQLLWHDLQREMLSISDQSEFIIAHESAHYIQDYEPNLIIEGIKQLLGCKI